MVCQIPTVQKHKFVHHWRKLCGSLCSSASISYSPLQQKTQHVQPKRNCCEFSSTTIYIYICVCSYRTWNFLLCVRSVLKVFLFLPLRLKFQFIAWINAARKSGVRICDRFQFEGRVFLVSWVDIRFNIQIVHFELQLFALCWWIL